MTSEENKNILFIFGTRPEAIKFAPLIKEAKKYSKFTIKIALTAQHREMLDQVLNFFDISGDYDLNLMKPGQDLFSITTNALSGLRDIYMKESPDLVFVQGDTTTVLAGALAAYYLKIPIAHLEAGLRSNNLYSPFPEEGNRVLTGHISTMHFCPTEISAGNLFSEGIRKNIFIVGNTVIDALFNAKEKIENNNQLKNEITEYFKEYTTNYEKIILITGHRRESFGTPFLNVCNAIKELANSYKNIGFIYPVHLNPNVQKPVNEILGNTDNVHLIPPIDYPKMVWLMDNSYLVLTDSGGIQEEAPALGKPVLVMREVTERQEGITAGTAKLVGTNKENIIKNTKLLIENENEYKKMAHAVNPYGDGTTSAKICKILTELL
jgi:UDP-N-acetylglucosamine 2-epimerase (non-hydrolysing)